MVGRNRGPSLDRLLCLALRVGVYPPLFRWKWPYGTLVANGDLEPLATSDGLPAGGSDHQRAPRALLPPIKSGRQAE
ncbi:hypothetical protein D3C86_2026380 [compost metagenome]